MCVCVGGETQKKQGDFQTNKKEFPISQCCCLRLRLFFTEHCMYIGVQTSCEQLSFRGAVWIDAESEKASTENTGFFLVFFSRH